MFTSNNIAIRKYLKKCSETVRVNNVRLFEKNERYFVADFQIELLLIILFSLSFK